MAKEKPPRRPASGPGPAPSRGRCGLCGSTRVVPVLYGLPGPGMLEQAERDEILLGGCVILPDREVLHCRDCGAGFRQDSGWHPARPQEPEES